ncbi:MAG TPA: ATP synthase F0 subunit B [Firmicutes bacterium]|nr:ATP synthase F0 subunit B [Bacillota bacterium]
MLSMFVLAAPVAPEGRVFGLDAQTLIGVGIQLLNGIILAVALGFILYKPVKEFMQRRAEGIQSQMDNAEAMMAKANALVAEYERKIKNIDQERLELLEAVRQKAVEESKVILEEARKEAAALRRRSLERVAEDKKRLQEEARLHIIEVASLMAQKYLAQKIDEATEEQLFAEAIAQLEEAQWPN